MIDKPERENDPDPRRAHWVRLRNVGLVVALVIALGFGSMAQYFIFTDLTKLAWLLLGALLLYAVYQVIIRSFGWVSLILDIRRRSLLSETEWMKRGGLMEAPTPGAPPDTTRIEATLEALPSDVRESIGAEITAYLAMPDDDDKQLCRDRLIRKYYDRAGTSKEDLAHRKSYNALRLALSPWAETELE